jgi:rhodanese-related sulfurtransferase
MLSNITREELKANIDHQSAFVLVEALPVEQYRKGHLPHAINLPPDQVKALAPKLLSDKRQEIVVYCASSNCDASERAARELVELGYQDVRRYVGGKRDWSEAGFPLTREEHKQVA